MISPNSRTSLRRLPLWTALVIAVQALLLPGQAPAEETRRHGEGRLWQVTQPGVPPSYVFGTMHTSDPQVVDLPSEVAAAFESADRVVLELIMSPQAGFKLAQSMVLTDGRTLPDLTGEARFEQVVETAERYGLPAAQMKFFRPWAVMTFFSLPPDELRREAAGEKALDQMLQARAEAVGTPVHGLESPEEQIAVLSGLSDEDQVALLDVALRLNPEIDTLFERMKQAYLAGDLAALHVMAEEQSADADPRLTELFEERLIGQRNELMTARLDDYLKQGGAFIAVGALHLSGDDGVLHLLEQNGYQVERVL